LSANSQYARAHLGLGTVYKDRAEALAPSQRASTPDLQNAIDQYQQALEGAAISPGALVDVKANLGLATTFILKGEMQRDQGDLNGAIDSFNSSLQLAQAAQAPLVDSQEFRSLAQAYLTEGQAYHELAQLKLMAGDNSASQGFFNKAIAAYEQCKAQQVAAPADAVLGDQVVGQLCIPYQKDAQDALKKLQGGS
jgi:tetratricopeptide (TPR) repeat protein